MPDDHTKVLLNEHAEKERAISDKSYSPILLWKTTKYIAGIATAVLVTYLVNIILHLPTK